MIADAIRNEVASHGLNENCMGQGIVGCTPSKVPRHGKSLLESPISRGYSYGFFPPQESLG